MPVADMAERQFRRDEQQRATLQPRIGEIGAGTPQRRAGAPVGEGVARAEPGAEQRNRTAQAVLRDALGREHSERQHDRQKHRRR